MTTTTIKTISMTARNELMARLALRKSEKEQAEEARRRAEDLIRQAEEEKAREQAQMELEIVEACKTAEILIQHNAEFDQYFLVDPDREEVMSVKGDPDGKTLEERQGDLRVMGPYDAICEFCYQLFSSGNVRAQIVDGELESTIYEEEFLHCVVPVRVTAAIEMVKILAEERKAGGSFNGNDLRALTRAEICEVLKDYGIVVEIPRQSQTPYLTGTDYPVRYAPGSNGNLTGKWLQRWSDLVKLLLSLESQKEEIRLKTSEVDFASMATVGNIEEALEKGGIYFARIPEGKFMDDGGSTHVLPGGDVLLRFADGAVTILSNEETVFAVSDSQIFEDRVLKICEDDAEITFHDVDVMLNTLDIDANKPTRFIAPRNGVNSDLGFWRLVWRHIQSYRKDKEIKKSRQRLLKQMSREGDIPEEQFSVSKQCSAVLSLPSFNLVMPGGQALDISPAAIRVVVEQELEDEFSIRVEDICEGFNHLREKLFLEGGGRKFLAKNPGGFLSHFLLMWGRHHNL